MEQEEESEEGDTERTEREREKNCERAQQVRLNDDEAAIWEMRVEQLQMRELELR